MTSEGDLGEPTQSLTLLDYRRRVADLYRQVRDMGGGEDAWAHWTNGRDDLLRRHPQSPIPSEERTKFNGLTYFPYDPTLRFELPLQPLAGEGSAQLGHSGAGSTGFRVVGFVSVPLGDGDERLSVHWLDGYGGGLFLAFRDGTSGSETYGGGRYLLDSTKGADLGSTNQHLVVDFNFAYHPSCVHSPRWSCPLPPADNRLGMPIRGGERLR
jgi:uncharacterized protein (DUF1684 family)